MEIAVIRTDDWLVDSIEHCNRSLDLLNRHGDADRLALQICPRSAGTMKPTPYGMIHQAMEELIAVACQTIPLDDIRDFAVERIQDYISPAEGDRPVREAIQFVQREIDQRIREWMDERTEARA